MKTITKNYLITIILAVIFCFQSSTCTASLLSEEVDGLETIELVDKKDQGEEGEGLNDGQSENDETIDFLITYMTQIKVMEEFATGKGGSEFYFSWHDYYGNFDGHKRLVKTIEEKVKSLEKKGENMSKKDQAITLLLTLGLVTGGLDEAINRLNKLFSDNQILRIGILPTYLAELQLFPIYEGLTNEEKTEVKSLVALGGLKRKLDKQFNETEKEKLFEKIFNEEMNSFQDFMIKNANKMSALIELDRNNFAKAVSQKCRTVKGKEFCVDEAVPYTLDEIFEFMNTYKETGGQEGDEVRLSEGL